MKEVFVPPVHLPSMVSLLNAIDAVNVDASTLRGGLSAVEWFVRELDRYTYKPSFKMKIFTPLDAFGATSLYKGVSLAVLRILMLAEDTHNPGREIEVVGYRNLTDREFGHPEMFARTLAEFLKDFEIHESREWLRRDGEIYDNPHK